MKIWIWIVVVVVVLVAAYFLLVGSKSPTDQPPATDQAPSEQAVETTTDLDATANVNNAVGEEPAADENAAKPAE